MTGMLEFWSNRHTTDNRPTELHGPTALTHGEKNMDEPFWGISEHHFISNHGESDYFFSICHVFT